ncbi:hypothetical protein [Streptomyces sp. NPDC054787]
MPTVVEIVLIIIGLILLVLALIGSGISRRLMTIPKMHKTPRIALAILGVLLLAGGMLSLSIESKTNEPSLDELRGHIPPAVKSALVCTEAAEAPKRAVSMNCSTEGSIPEYVFYIKFPDVNVMQEYWMKQTGAETLSGTQCSTMDDFKKGSKQQYYLSDQSVIIGDYACYTAGPNTVAMYTDRRYNVLVWAQISDPKQFTQFMDWINLTSQPVGDANVTPATPSHTVAEMR